MKSKATHAPCLTKTACPTATMRPRLEAQPALVVNHDNPAAPSPAVVENRIAAHLDDDVRQEGLSGLPDDVRRQRLMEYFRDRVADVLGLAPDKVDPDRPLMSLGLDSLSAMDLKVEIDAGLGTTLPLSMLMEGSGIRELAERVSERLAGAPTGSNEPAAPAEGEPATVEAGPPLSHGQQMLWYAHQFTTTGAAYHVLGAGLVRAELDEGAFRRAMRPRHCPPGGPANHLRPRRREARGPPPGRGRTRPPRGRMAPDRGRRGL